jgi:hypothetical protein
MMQAHLRELRLRWETDRKRNAPGVYMPQAIALKYPAASREWIWFWVFPARQPYTDKRTRCCAYWHMHPSRLQKQVHVETTMIYTHVATRNKRGVRSPFEGLSSL